MILWVGGDVRVFTGFGKGRRGKRGRARLSLLAGKIRFLMAKEIVGEGEKARLSPVLGSKLYCGEFPFSFDLYRDY